MYYSYGGLLIHNGEVLICLHFVGDASIYHTDFIGASYNLVHHYRMTQEYADIVYSFALRDLRIAQEYSA